MSDDKESQNESTVLLMLIALMAALIGVGFVSGTPIRHFIQIAPIVATVLLLIARVRIGASIAMGIFPVWIQIVTLIWLYLFGIADIVNGTFSPEERALTIVMGGASLIGLVGAIVTPKRGPIWLNVLAVLLGAAVQIAALNLSFGPAYATM